MPDDHTPSTSLPLTREAMSDIARRALATAKRLGASDAEIEVSAAVGQSVTVYFGQRRGNASTSDLGLDGVEKTVEAACAIARHTAEDPAAGLPDKGRLYHGKAPDLDLYHPWGLTVEEAIELAKRTEAAGLAVDKRISNTDGATVSSYDSDFVLANTRDFLDGFATSKSSLSCSVVAEDKAGMQRDYWYSTHRDPQALESAESVGRKAGERTVSRLGAKRLPTGDVPVLFEANVAGSLLGHFVQAASGSSLYRHASFLEGKLGTQVFSPHVFISEDPHRRGEMASAFYDAEGVATTPRLLVDGGVLNGWFLSSYSGRKLGLPSTGNAGGNHNLILAPGELDLEGLLRKMGRGFLVTEMMGQGVNAVTGDYSRGASGFWVEGGDIRFPVEEVTIAGNLADMFKGIVAIGRDVLVRGSRQSGSILIDRMTIAGD